MHPQWKRGNTGKDIGLVLLDTPLYGSSVRVLPKLWTHAGGYNPKAGQRLRAIGYGFNNHQGAGAQQAGIKKAVNLFVSQVYTETLQVNAYDPQLPLGHRGYATETRAGHS